MATSLEICSASAMPWLCADGVLTWLQGKKRQCTHTLNVNLRHGEQYRGLVRPCSPGLRSLRDVFREVRLVEIGEPEVWKFFG